MTVSYALDHPTFFQYKRTADSQFDEDKFVKNNKLLPLVIALAALAAPAHSAVRAQPAEKVSAEAQKENSSALLAIDVDGQDYLFAVRKDAATGAMFAQHRSHSSHSSHSSHRSHYSSR